MKQEDNAVRVVYLNPYILTGFKNATLGLQLNFHFHEREKSDRCYCMLKTDKLLVSHEKDFTIQ